jgi:cell division septation protein DedD
MPAVSSSPAVPAQAPERSGPSALSNARDSALYRVQVGAFSARKNAQELFDRLSKAGFSPVFEAQGRLTKVHIPRVRANEIPAISRRLNNLGLKDIWIHPER